MLITVPCKVGKTKITSKNQISLPAEALRKLGWERGDELIVSTWGDRIILHHVPKDAADYFLGKMGDVFGDHDEVMRFFDEERRGWEEWQERQDELLGPVQ